MEPFTFVKNPTFWPTMKQVLLFLMLSTMVLTRTEALHAQTNISFEVSFSEPQAHYADIKMDLSGLQKPYIDLVMPVWTPGSYLVREYARHLESFEACLSDGTPLKWEKISKNIWRVHTGKNKSASVHYRLYGFEVSVRTNYIDQDHAFLSPAATFLHPQGQLQSPATIRIVPHAAWKQVSTGLEAVTGEPYTYYAPDFDILYDSPIEIGNQEIFTFEASGVTHEVAMVNAGYYDKARLIKDYTKIIETCTDMFGVNPNKRYVFIVHHFQSGGGGLEHLNSTVLGASRNTYVNERSYTGFLGLVAHEYFHLWVVKRLRPIELGPFNYSEENYTTGLWIMEGFTSYFDNLILRKAGLISPNDYLDMILSDVNTVESKSGNKIQPVALASWDAWIKYYRQDENSNNSSISYYNKGALLAWLLDLKIMTETKGQKRLEDVLRTAYQYFYEEKNRGFKEVELEEHILKTTGVNVSDLFALAHNVDPLPYNTYLNKIGYNLIDINANGRAGDLGVTTKTENGRLVIGTVERGSSAWDAGLSVKDEVLAINGQRVDASGRDLLTVGRQVGVGGQVDILVSRDGLLRNIPVTIKADTKTTYRLVPLATATAEQKALGAQWIYTK
jgi:predicted metalloprotease with PDZ domain